jgi:tRNA-dihydrouridine synthase
MKGKVKIPLITTNRINTPEVGEKILAEGCADMVSMARPLLADPEFVNKAAAGKADEINTCIGCNQACLDHTFSGKITSCLVNPRACHETILMIEPVTAKPSASPWWARARRAWQRPRRRHDAATRSRCLKLAKMWAGSSTLPSRSRARKSFTRRCVTTATRSSCRV